MRGKTVCKFSVKMKIQVVSIFSKTNRLLYSTTAVLHLKVLFVASLWVWYYL